MSPSPTVAFDMEGGAPATPGFGSPARTGLAGTRPSIGLGAFKHAVFSSPSSGKGFPSLLAQNFVNRRLIVEQNPLDD
jgi:hypothetical protein